MVRRIDTKHSANPNYVYVVGADKVSSTLQSIHEEINKKYISLLLDYSSNNYRNSESI